MAVRVWLRANERISVRLFGIIVVSKSFQKAPRIGVETQVREEARGLRAHDIASHMAIVIRTTSASEIR